MIDAETRAALLAEGWSPPPLENYEPWRKAVVAYWNMKNVTSASLATGGEFNDSDKRAAEALAAAQPFMPPLSSE